MEVIGRVNLGRKCSGDVGMWGCLPAEKGGMQQGAWDVGSISELAWTQHCGDMQAPLARWIQLSLSAVELSHLPLS